MQKTMRAVCGLMGLTLLSACGGGDKDADRVAPAAGKAAAEGKSPAPAPTKGAASAPSKTPAKAAAPAPTKTAATAPPKAAPAASKSAAPAAPKGVAAAPAARPATGWPELDAFHKILSDTWHPASTGDLKLARANAAQVLAAALAWRASRGSTKCDNAESRKGMAMLIEDARSYADAAKRDASDDAITVTLRRTHGDFEAMAEPCVTGDMKMDAPKKP